MLSRRFATVVTVVIVVAFVVVAVAPAFAATPESLALHARLLGSTPKDGGSVVTAEEVVLAFNEDVDPTFVRVTVAGPGGSEVGGPPTVDGREVTQPLTPDLPAGEHVVTYRVVSTDGHPVSGKVTFTTTTAPTASATPPATATASAAPSARTPPATAPVADDSSSPWPVLLGGLAVVAMLVALGTALARRPRAGDPEPGEDSAAAPVSGTGSGTDAGRDPFT